MLQARPNGLMVAVADEVMGLDGRLVAAVAGMEAEGAWRGRT